MSHTEQEVARTLAAYDTAPTQKLTQAFPGCDFEHDDENGGWFLIFEDGDRYHVTQSPLDRVEGGVMYRFNGGPSHRDPVIAFQAMLMMGGSR